MVAVVSFSSFLFSRRVNTRTNSREISANRWMNGCILLVEMKTKDGREYQMGRKDKKGKKEERRRRSCCLLVFYFCFLTIFPCCEEFWATSSSGTTLKMDLLSVFISDGREQSLYLERSGLERYVIREISCFYLCLCVCE